MKLRALFLIVCGVMVTGCSLPMATQRPTPVNHLQIKVAQMDRQLKANTNEIEDLKEEVDGLSSQLPSSRSSVSSSSSSRKYVVEDEPASTSKSTYTQKSTSSSTGTIRVPVSSKRIQTALKNAGYYDGTIDGKIGSGTKKAISEFQRDHDLTPDGVIGKRTWVELKNYLE